MAKISYVQGRLRRICGVGDDAMFGTGSGGGEQDSMEIRLNQLEKLTADIRERTARVEAGLAYVATKQDVASVESTLLKWFVATAIALTSLAFAAAKLVH